MKIQDTVELSLAVPAGVDEIKQFLAAVDGAGSKDDTLSVEMSLDESGGDMMLLDSEGFPLFVLTLRPQS